MTRVCLVTGGNGGLGRFVVESFLKNDDIVIVADLNLEKSDLKETFSKYSKNLFLISTNVTNEESVLKLLEKIKEKYKSIDILVNVVGGFSMSKITETKTSELNNMFNLNVMSAFLCCKHIIPIISNEQGRIVNISARAGLKAIPNAGAYCIAKSGVISLTETLAAENFDTNITVNSILPSIIDTPANRSAMPNEDFDKWVSPKDISNVIFFLCSKEAKAINGANIPVYNKS